MKKILLSCCLLIANIIHSSDLSESKIQNDIQTIESATINEQIDNENSENKKLSKWTELAIIIVSAMIGGLTVDYFLNPHGHVIYNTNDLSEKASVSRTYAFLYNLGLVSLNKDKTISSYDYYHIKKLCYVNDTLNDVFKLIHSFQAKEEKENSLLIAQTFNADL